jgi:hypothetical protein
VLRPRNHDRSTCPGLFPMHLAIAREPPQAVIHSARDLATLEHRIVSMIFCAKAYLMRTCVHSVDYSDAIEHGLLFFVTCWRPRSPILRCTGDLGFSLHFSPRNADRRYYPQLHLVSLEHGDPQARPLFQLSVDAIDDVSLGQRQWRKWV